MVNVFCRNYKYNRIILNPVFSNSVINGIVKIRFGYLVSLDIDLH
jgi:hypothetical protein